MKKILRRLTGILALILLAVSLGSGSAEGTETGLENFTVRF